MSYQGNYNQRSSGTNNYILIVKRCIFLTPRDTSDILAKNIEMKEKIDKSKRGMKDWFYDINSSIDFNLYLLFTKYLPAYGENSKGLPDFKGNEKTKYLEAIKNHFSSNTNTKSYQSLKNLAKGNYDRIQNLIKSLLNLGYACKSIEAIPKWRLVVGLGASHPQETSMILHHIYGIPYIPGSAVKGITRHWALTCFADKISSQKNSDFYKEIEQLSKGLDGGFKEGSLYGNLSIQLLDKKVEKEEKIELSDLVEIFGTQEQKGKVIFMDAYPVDEIKLEIDIMNPHYPDYYSGNKPPADCQNPNPITFLTVGKTKFQFCLLSKDNNLLNKATLLLEEALKEHGIGAKTALGYGIFDI
ncbi:MAG: type III-B CRISPR module RAMP protein Cmr6 [Spirochaetia bacterium]|nr:type III-B CRISPR module RAMP protein Cmr6 [Spirochaetota bacterium]MDW8113259.1 type III-B CRISPR module RAMP protein Cmr6 [Spirochaetia bacterium]